MEPQKSVDEQVKDIVDKLRSIIALKSENLHLEIIIPASICFSIICCSKIHWFFEKRRMAK